ncbi:hypothetical protein ZHAS_00008684 [Anopheles sinensis]|uniref:Uncharacterized protein n=1 Tax=Anopheles sinensis TaxID=74873 RepID=A0A084VT36_ANOSI|nr:hypothetical protein ZHAS_00008684 [Anopheles sinensis]
MKNRKLGMAGVGAEMDLLTVPTKITPVKQMLAELQSDDEEPGLGYTHTLVSTRRSPRTINPISMPSCCDTRPDPDTVLADPDLAFGLGLFVRQKVDCVVRSISGTF